MKVHYAALAAVLLVMALSLASCAGDGSDTAQRSQENQRLRFEQLVSNAPGPPCDYIEWGGPYRHNGLMCSEIAYDNVTSPEAAPALLGMALAPDGTLYFTRPAFGEIWAMRDADGDQFMDAPFRVAAGLDLPQYVTPDGDDLLVTSIDGLLRLVPDGPDVYGDPVVLVDDLNADSGMWPGAVRVGPDGRIYAGLGASPDEPGAVISVAADGSDRRVEAAGLRYPADFTWHPVTGDLWIVDQRGEDAAYDALFRVPAGAATVPDFGYPACAQGTESACDGVTPPSFTFARDSAPAGMLFYTFEEWGFWYGDLLVTLAGSWNHVEPDGYGVLVVDFGADYLPTGDSQWFMPVTEYRIAPQTVGEYSLLGFGFFPYHVADVVIDEQGWVYIGVQEGRIFRVRPRPANRPGGPLTPTPPPSLESW